MYDNASGIIGHGARVHEGGTSPPSSVLSRTLPFQTLSCNITPLIVVPCHELSPSPQTHNVGLAPSDL